MGRLKVRDARDGVDATLIVDEDGRIVAMCRQRDEAIDLAAAWNVTQDSLKAQPTERTPQQEQELEIGRSRGEL